jgi:hypothetical protein
MAFSLLRDPPNKEICNPQRFFCCIPDGKRVIRDCGYKGEPDKVSITREGHSDDVRKYFG